MNTTDPHESDGKLLENGKCVVRQEKTRKLYKTSLLGLADILISVFVVAPLVVITWRGLWSFMDFYADYFPMVPCFIVGVITHIILALSQDSLHAILIEPTRNWTCKILAHCLTRCYTYLFLAITVLHWRGGWAIIDNLTGIQLTPDFMVKKEGSQLLMVLCIACLATLLLIRCLINATAPPFAVCIDRGDYVFRFPSMFERKSKRIFFLNLLDWTFSVGFVGNLGVTFWRGLWGLADIIILPNDFVGSSWASLILGLLLVGFVFRLQNCINNLCARLKGLSKIALADFYVLLSCVATILYWRGIWYLTNIYFLPNNIELGNVLSHLIGFMLLIVLDCSNSLLVRGIYIDGKEPNSDCALFSCQYLAIIFEQKELEQDAEELDLNNIETKLDL